MVSSQLAGQMKHDMRFFSTVACMSLCQWQFCSLIGDSYSLVPRPSFLFFLAQEEGLKEPLTYVTG
jgi:hypothetical protein